MSGPFGAVNKTAVPIIGQPFTLKNYGLTVQIICNCSAKEPVLLMATAIAQCPACHRTFQLQGVKANPAGQLSFAIALMSEAKSETDARES